MANHPDGEKRDQSLIDTVLPFLNEMDEYRKENRRGITTSLWLNAVDGHAYLRIGDRVLRDGAKTYVTVSNVEVWTSYRNKGLFRKMMDLIEDWAAMRGYGVIIENVSSPIIAAMYREDPFWEELMVDVSRQIICSPGNVQAKVKERHQ